MTYSKDFFKLQFQFADKLAAKIGTSVHHALFNYTTIPVSFELSDLQNPTDVVWASYLNGLAHATDTIEWTYEFYLKHKYDDPTPTCGEFRGHRLFGSFYYVLRVGHVVRPGFINRKDNVSSMSSLSQDRMGETMNDLAAMFHSLTNEVTDVNVIEGNSWLYNLEAYRRVFPPEYTLDMQENDDPDFQYLMIWGQFLDKDGGVKTSLASEFLSRVEDLSSIKDLRFCFPFQPFKPRCNVGCFTDFYKSKFLK